MEVFAREDRDPVVEIARRLRESSHDIYQEMRHDAEILEAGLSRDNVHCRSLRRRIAHFRTYLEAVLSGLEQRQGQVHEEYARQYLHLLSYKVSEESKRFFDELFRIVSATVNLLHQQLSQAFVKLVSRHRRGRAVPYTIRRDCHLAHGKINGLRAMVTEDDVMAILPQFWVEMEETNQLIKDMMARAGMGVRWTMVERYLDHTLGGTTREDESEEEEEEDVDFDEAPVTEMFHHLDQRIEELEEEERLRTIQRQGMLRPFPSRRWQPPDLEPSETFMREENVRLRQSQEPEGALTAVRRTESQEETFYRLLPRSTSEERRAGGARGQGSPRPARSLPPGASRRRRLRF